MENLEDMRGGMIPIGLAPTRVWRTYTGGKLLEEWLGTAQPVDGHQPEDWMSSLVPARNPDGKTTANEGLSRVMAASEESILFKELIETDPALFLGAGRAEKAGATLGFLVKALDALERLTIQVHPDKAAAMDLFGSTYGKTEAWYIVGGREIDGVPPYVMLGFKPGITRKRFEDLFRRQDIPGMLAAMHKFEAKPGRVFLVEGGVPHAIGSGCFLIEIQEPTDYTIRTERTTPFGLQIPDALCHQGLGFERMFDCFDFNGCTHEEAVRKWFRTGRILAKDAGGIEVEQVGYDDTPCFRLERLDVFDRLILQNLEHSFSILAVLAGQGELMWERGCIPLGRGDRFFLPAGLSELVSVNTCASPLTLIRCFPPRF